MTIPQDDQRVDELRRQLRALGYLDAGVDRFVLGPASGARRPAAIAALASLRVGMLAAALLGPAAAIGLRTRLPGLVTSAQDALVIALYLAVLFGIAAIVFSFAASMLVSRFAATTDAGRARFLSRAAGTIVAVGCLAYLTLWWRSANTELAWTAPGWTAVALLVAVLISLLLGHAVAITTFAVMAAKTPIESPGGASRSTRWLVVAAGVLAFVGASGLLVLASGTPGATEAPRLAVVSPGIRVRVFAVDGFDPKVFDELRGAGRIPALAAFFQRGYLRVPAEATWDPARAWTTIATGQPPAVHGVQSLETRRVAGVQGSVDDRGLPQAVRGATDLLRLTRPAIASGVERRAKTFWEVAADGGLRAVVVNWWATWPASESGPHPPTILSDRATLRLEKGGALDAEIAPKEIYERLRGDWPAIKQQVAATVQERLPPTPDAAIAATLRRSAELDALQLALSARFDSASPDLVVVYLPGLDIAQHTLLAPAEGSGASALAARLDAVRNYYLFLDALLARALTPSPDSLAIMLTEPGRRASDAFGTLALSGSIVATRVDGSINSVDVAPTLLHVLGIPASRALAGRPALQAFAPEFLSRYPVREVTTYGDPNVGRTVRQGQPLDDEMVERLRSLGYVR